MRMFQPWGGPRSSAARLRLTLTMIVIATIDSSQQCGRDPRCRQDVGGNDPTKLGILKKHFALEIREMEPNHRMDSSPVEVQAAHLAEKDR